MTELAQKLEDVVERQIRIISEYKMMQPTLKSVLSTQGQILNRLSSLERLVHCAPHQGQFHQEELGGWSWGHGVYSFDVSDTVVINRPSTSPRVTPVHQPPVPPTQSAAPTPSGSEPLLLPFKNTNKNVLDSSEIAKADENLTSVSSVLSKYPKLRCESKIATLAVKLAKEALFGEKILVRCTVVGERTLPGLPIAEVNELKTIIFRQFPQYWRAKHEFESVWKTIVDCVGQACKRLRCKQFK